MDANSQEAAVLSDDAVRAVLEAAGKATPQPWFLDSGGICCGVSQGTSYRDRGVFITDETTWADGEYIALACNLAPALCRSWLALAGRLREAEAALNKIMQDAITHPGAGSMQAYETARSALPFFEVTIGPEPDHA